MKDVSAAMWLLCWPGYTFISNTTAFPAWPSYSYSFSCSWRATCMWIPGFIVFWLGCLSSGWEDHSIFPHLLSISGFLHRKIMPFLIIPVCFQLALQNNTNKAENKQNPPPKPKEETITTKTNTENLIPLRTTFILSKWSVCVETGRKEEWGKKIPSCLKRFPLFKLSGNRKEKVLAAILIW